jgi:glycosyltransferase involved in cell wall biosynthesis
MTASESAVERRSATSASNEQPTVSIVVPAFNEASRIGASLRKIDQFLRKTPRSMEVIIVDDGSTDDTSGMIHQAQFPGLRIIRNDQNHGKGYSVRQGVLAARGVYVLYTDADLSAPIEELEKFLDVAMGEAVDVVVGSRAVDRTLIEKHQSAFRELGGVLYNRMVRLLLGLRIRDTQCGFKLFDREKSRPAFEQLTTLGFGFDPELLFLCKRRGLRIRELPVRWSHSEGSKVNFLRDGIRMLGDLARIRWNSIIGKY